MKAGVVRGKPSALCGCAFVAITAIAGCGTWLGNLSVLDDTPVPPVTQADLPEVGTPCSVQLRTGPSMLRPTGRPVAIVAMYDGESQQHGCRGIVISSTRRGDGSRPDESLYERLPPDVQRVVRRDVDSAGAATGRVWIPIYAVGSIDRMRETRPGSFVMDESLANSTSGNAAGTP